MSIVSVSWCEQCQSGPRCIVNGRCGGNIRPKAELPTIGNGTLIVTVENAGCPGPQSVWLSWGSAFPIERSHIDGRLTYLYMTAPKSPQAGDYLMILSEGPSWPLTFLDPLVSVSCLGRGCIASVSQGTPFYATVSNMQVTSASQLEVSIADSPVVFTLVSSNATETVLLIIPPDCANCRFSPRSHHCRSTCCAMQLDICHVLCRAT